MNIQSIQIAQGLLTRTGEGKVSLGKGKSSAESDLPVQEISLPAAKENKILPENSNSSSTQGDAFEIFYPPFFPMGNTQGIYQAMMEAQPQSSESVQVQKADSTKAETNAAANAQSGQVAEKKDMTVESGSVEVKQTSQPGTVLDLKV